MKMDDLLKKSKHSLESKLFKLFDELNTDSREISAAQAAEDFQIYSGNDEVFKEKLQAFLGDKTTIYDSLELNSAVKSLISKYIQPFLSQDDMITFAPLDGKVALTERVSKLINDQIKSNDFIRELATLIKDSCIHGIGFIAIGWRTETISAPKKVLVREEDPISGKIYESESYVMETFTKESPDFRTLKVTDVLFPRVSRWDDIPYVIRREIISTAVFNERYNQNLDEIGTRDKYDDYEVALDILLDKVAGSNKTLGDGAYNQVELLHYHFRNGDYIVARLDTNGNEKSKINYGLQIVHQGKSPIPGVAIPIFPLVLEPITGRLVGESIVRIGKNEARKLTEMDNLHLMKTRASAADPLLIGSASGVDPTVLIDRMPNMPIEVPGQLSEIQPLKISSLGAEFMQSRTLYKQALDSTLGSTDFFRGDIGASARLTGVTSLLANALSRLSVGLSQISKLTLDIADALLLANRAFLPKSFIHLQTSTHAADVIESHEIPYPMHAKISSPVDAGADKGSKIAAIYQFLQTAISIEQVQPGTFDINGLLLYAYSQSGFTEAKRFFLKSPFTEGEVATLQQIDQVLRMMNQSAFTNSENPLGQPANPTQQQTGQAGNQASRFNNNMPGMDEISGMST